jgi:two-component system, chemotaxis family, protein-glutamate methylesterase/glutaminase
MNLKPKIRVLVVDDSSLVRRMISTALSRDPEIEVVGTAADPYEARDKILSLNPDVLTLDIEMPRMDGITFLGILSKHRPLPVIVISSISQAGSETALKALEAGAVEVIGKPTSSWSIGELGQRLGDCVKAAAFARLPASAAAVANPSPRITTPLKRVHYRPEQLVLLGASTGGTEALKNVLTRLPAEMPGICIVQHIPPVFSKAFADRLNELCELEVREAVTGDEVRPGLALVAPGDYHMELRWERQCYRVVLNQTPPLHHTRPAVDKLFNSVVASAPNVVAALLTGMGRDGALGMKHLHAAGAKTIAQDEASCVVYGMPRAAVEFDAVDSVVPLDQIPDALWRAVQGRATSAESLSKPVAAALTTH